MAAEQLTDKSITALYVKYFPKLRNMFLRLLATEQYDRVAAAEDLVQRTFLMLWLKRATFRGDSAVSTWLYAIAKNEFTLRFRELKKSQGEGRPIEIGTFLESKDGIRYERHKASCKLTQEGELLKQEVAAHLQDLIMSLPVALRIVFLLHERDGLLLREIATRLALNESTAKTSLAKAKVKMKAMTMAAGSQH